MIKQSSFLGTLSLVLVFAFLPQGHVAAAPGTEPVLPAAISAGFDAYKSGGPHAAMSAWLKGSPLEGDKQAQSQAGMLVQIETYYGKYVGAAPLGTFEPSPGTTLTFTGLRFEKGPVFAKFLIFKTGDKEAIVQLKFHTDPDQILPSQLLYKSK